MLTIITKGAIAKLVDMGTGQIDHDPNYEPILKLQFLKPSKRLIKQKGKGKKKKKVDGAEVRYPCHQEHHQNDH